MLHNRYLTNCPLPVARASSRGGTLATSNVKATTLVPALSTALSVLALSWIAAAKAYDSEYTVHANGAVLATQEELGDLPRTPLFRAGLPPSVDLRDRYHPAGEQGSSVGCAIGYAPRSCRGGRSGGGAWLTARYIPSPAYVYDRIRNPGASCDNGSRIVAALDLLKKGSLILTELPYDEDRCRRPSAGMAARA